MKRKSKEPDMVKFKCITCSREYYDMNLYFYDRPSTKCMWCTKYPVKDKKVIKK